jgi:hypothetical protein
LGRANIQDGEEEIPLGTFTSRPHGRTFRRRSQRVLISVPIRVSGVRPDGKPFSEETHTSVVNSHGASLVLGETVSQEQILTIRNLNSEKELHGIVVDVHMAEGGKREVGVEFAEESPRFWSIAFPPENWNVRSHEAKRISLAPKRPLAKRDT